MEKEKVLKRSAGVLLNVSSLPGPYGIGSFSVDAERFVEEIASMGFSVWQTLPLTVSGWGNSPYSSVSSFAGNYLYIDPERLYGLVGREEIERTYYRGDYYLTNYDFARTEKRRVLELAYSRITNELKEKIDEFVEKNAFWLPDYAVYMTLKESFEQKSWLDWDEKHKKYTLRLRDEVIRDKADRVGYYCFEQYVFFDQWEKIRACAKGYGVKIFGDLPIYVCLDSADVWAHRKQFLLDADGRPTLVAGVPPDYFAEDGQLWGNPLYDYAAMKKDGYKWWVERLTHALDLYDIVRIDHFRGLCQYWGVPADAKTAKEGKWYDGPKTEIFDALKKVRPEHLIVAEDLGIIDDKVEKLLSDTGYPGMRVMQFGFDGDCRNKHLPHEYEHACVAYTGTHDNDTTLGWLLSLDENTRKAALDYVNCDGGYGWASGGGYCRATKAFVRSLMASCATLAVVPMQDLCGYGSDTRMNTPGVAEGCWRYRTNYGAIDNVDREFVREMIRIYGR
ncbi:MAG: 4-alpha-glucanotransferase [Clostridia bacterium]|nr:4-alpha-glucanotransferase [Clostridia bacterium]